MLFFPCLRTQSHNVAVNVIFYEELDHVQATSLERLDHSPSIVLFDAIQSRIVEIADSVKPDEKQALEKAFSKLGYGHDAISKKV